MHACRRVQIHARACNRHPVTSTDELNHATVDGASVNISQAVNFTSHINDDDLATCIALDLSASFTLNISLASLVEVSEVVVTTEGSRPTHTPRFGEARVYCTPEFFFFFLLLFSWLVPVRLLIYSAYSLARILLLHLLPAVRYQGCRNQSPLCRESGAITGSLFEEWSRSEYSFACLAYRQEF